MRYDIAKYKGLSVPPLKSVLTREQVRAILTRQNTPEARFGLAFMAHTDSHGGHPTCGYEDGIGIVFTYPDGTRTSRGNRIA